MAYKNFENPFYHQQEVIDSIYKRSVEQLNRDEIDPNDFRDLYGDENVDKDLAEVNKLEEAIRKESLPADQESLKLATILEAMIHYHGEQSNWFGQDAETFKTTRFDDLKNGTDGVVEFVEEQRASHLAFGIDATYGHYSDKKVERILKRIKNGQLAKIKYFESDNSHFRGELKKVPLFVVAIGKQRIVETSEMWLEKQKTELAIHPIQMQILSELVEQATAFANFAEANDQVDIAKRYQDIGEKIGKIINEKLDQGIEQDHDDLFYELSHQVERQIELIEQGD